MEMISSGLCKGNEGKSDKMNVVIQWKYRKAIIGQELYYFHLAYMQLMMQMFSFSQMYS